MGVKFNKIIEEHSKYERENIVKYVEFCECMKMCMQISVLWGL